MSRQIEPYYDRDGIVIYNADAKDILWNMLDNSIDFVFTDPPYGHNNNNGDLIHNWEKALGQVKRGKAAGDPRPIANDDPESAKELVKWFFIESNRILKKGCCCCCCCCCCCGGGPDPQFARWSLWMDKAFSGFMHMVVWDKGGLGMGWLYRRNYETVLISNKKGSKIKWYGGSNVPNVVKFSGIKPSMNQHPTEKPWQLSSFFIGLHSQKGETVVDPFMGGGSTLVAAKQLGRKAIGIELEKMYCDMAIEKLEKTSRKQSLF